MARLEDITKGAVVRGLVPGGLATVVDVNWYGTAAVEIVYKDASGKVANEVLYRDHEARLELVTVGKPWSFDADGRLLRLASEAQRIHLAYLFDPYLAVHTSLVEPLPHQITAVYQHMLPRQPLRYLLADDPGAGKTIMAGLYIKELLIRGDLQRCLVVCPGSLAEQWQDELWRRFHLPFDILTNDRIEASRTGNVFTEIPLLIARLDKLSRNEDLQEKLAQVDWDLVVCDEAHKMSATFWGGEVKFTKRYRLGQRLGTVARHFLLMTATPHNGKETDFQLFMALLDGDRFEGRFRDGVHTVDVADMMRRMVKEKLLKFDGTRLFPERKAYTVAYTLSDAEAVLYKRVTEYVRNEFNRAEALLDGGRTRTIGFALTILQRRLASSPEAIYQSLRRRRERLESKLREAKTISQGAQAEAEWARSQADITLSDDELDDLDDAPATEVEDLEEQLLDQATAARTVAELQIEIGTLEGLEEQARQVLMTGMDCKWEELSRLLQDEEAMFDGQGQRRKLVIFSEHRDTVRYVAARIQTLLGRAQAVVTIDGSIGREERRKTQEAFTQDKDVFILVATDAAGEGINLQRAHLMINYDLPWNPNRIEQRFGRIHRIGQAEVCHLWNLVANETREGDVYVTLLRKLEAESQALGGAVFDVLGQAIDGTELRRLMIEAIRYGDRPEVRARLTQKIEGALDRERLQALMEEEPLTHEIMDTDQVYGIRQMMERMEARRLQPHFIASFFKAAFEHLGGKLRERETGRHEITHVPAAIRQRDRIIGVGDPVAHRYERICFEKELISVPGKPVAAFICPGHPLLDAIIDLILERYRDLLKQGAALVDDGDPGEQLRVLVYLDHTIKDARTMAGGDRRTVSRRLQFVEFPLGTANDEVMPALASDRGPAPYLDYRPLKPEEQALVEARVDRVLSTHRLEQAAVDYAILNVVPRHLEETRRSREPLIDKTIAAVKDRLVREINYWDHRATQLKAQEQAGKVNARVNSAKARQRADELQARLTKRLAELAQERQLAALPPAVMGAVLVIPQGLLSRLSGQRSSDPATFARETKRVEQAAMDAVMLAEGELGHTPRDLSSDNLGYDIESLVPPADAGLAELRFLEVKGRIRGATSVTVTKNEILTAFNKPEHWILALVQVPPLEDAPDDVSGEMLRESRTPYGTHVSCQVRYVRRPFQREPDFDATSVNYDWRKLWARGSEPG